MTTPPTSIQVSGDTNYSVTVGRGILGQLPEVLGDRVNKVLIVHTTTVGRLEEELRNALQERYS